MSVVVVGRCLWWDEEQGFGVLVGEEPPGEVWVHFSSVEGTGYRSLQRAERVEFDWEEPRGGQDGFRYRATRVVRLGCT
jgi:CspA family cold shock protein